MTTKMNADALIDAVMTWGRAHKIFDPMTQYVKMSEEAGEIAHELTRSRFESAELVDAIGDTLVTIIILSDILDIDPMVALQKAYMTIKDRVGKTEHGNFIKEEE